MHARRTFLHQALTVGSSLALGHVSTVRGAEPAAPRPAAPRRVPVIDCTDLYHPHQDVGDNFDILAAYALPEIELRAVILDATEKYRQPPEGPREAGYIPILQLNSIFDRNVPCAVTPYLAMKSPQDPLREAPRFQQAGIELLLKTLAESRDQVDVLIFGAARAVAAAYNRAPPLLRDKIRRVHLCAGASSPDFLEWNVVLDPHAFVCLLRSDLPVAIYPCATKDGPFAYGPHNCFWKLTNLEFIRQMHPRLRSYLAYAFGRSSRIDFLRALDEDPPESLLQDICRRPHNVWETAVWAQVADRRLVRNAGGHYRLTPAAELQPGDQVLPNELRPCRVQVQDSGRFTFELTDQRSNFLMYDRGDPQANERALREALPAWYLSFRPG
jgi:pyrimidine-specific ribonucleoside hydrolase